VVSEILGHSQISLTLDTYSHVLPCSGNVATCSLAAGDRAVDVVSSLVAIQVLGSSFCIIPIELNFLSENRELYSAMRFNLG
jgi:hypothetical protein